MDFETLFNKGTKNESISGEKVKDLLALTFIIPEYYQYNIFRVPAKYIARPDLISIDQYGSSDYTDIVCKLNGISNPFEMNEGMVLILPTTGCLSQFYYSGDTIDSTAEDDSGIAKPKTKQEKRKANEAVVGDTRFKIDKERQIVIY